MPSSIRRRHLKCATAASRQPWPGCSNRSRHRLGVLEPSKHGCAQESARPWAPRTVVFYSRHESGCNARPQLGPQRNGPEPLPWTGVDADAGADAGADVDVICQSQPNDNPTQRSCRYGAQSTYSYTVHGESTAHPVLYAFFCAGFSRWTFGNLCILHSVHVRSTYTLGASPALRGPATRSVSALGAEICAP